MKKLQRILAKISAPLDRLSGAPVAQKGAPLLGSPIGISPVAHCAPTGAPLAQSRSDIGDGGQPVFGFLKVKSEENSQVRIVCDWCGAQGYLVWVSGHAQCNACHRVLVDCCNGETATNDPHSPKTPLERHQQRSRESGSRLSRNPDSSTSGEVSGQDSAEATVDGVPI